MKKLLILLALLPALACAQRNEVKTDRLLVGSSTAITSYVGINRSTSIAIDQGGIFTAIGGTAVGYMQSMGIAPPQTFDAYGVWLTPVLYKAAAGVHANFSTLLLSAPVITGGAATYTNAVTLNIAGPGVGASTRNLSIWVQSGTSQFDGAITTNAGIAATGQNSLARNIDAVMTAGTPRIRVYDLTTGGAFFEAWNATNTISLGIDTNAGGITGTANAPFLYSNAAIEIWAIAAKAMTISNTVVTLGAATGLTIPAIPSATGVRFLCISTTGVVSSQAAACVGT